MTLGNVFLSRKDLDSFSVPKNHLEPEYADSFRAWKEKDDESTRENLLTAIEPLIDKTLLGYEGGDPNYLRIQAKILAMKSLTKYDPERSKLSTYIPHQLLPLRRMERQQMNILGYPERMILALPEIENAEQEFLDKEGRLPLTTELSDKLGFSVKQIEAVRNMSHARNTGSQLVADEEGQVSGMPEVDIPIPMEYIHSYVLSGLQNDPKAALIYEYENNLHGRKKITNAELASMVGVSEGRVSQIKNLLRERQYKAQQEILGN